MTSEIFSETTEVSEEGVLTQGDVLKSVEPDVDAWRQHLVVVTADCDLAYRKYGGQLSCIPILSADRYANEFLLEPEIQKVTERLKEAFVKLIHTAQQSEAPVHDYVPITPGRAYDWALEAELDDMSQVLPRLDIEKAEPLHRLLRETRGPESTYVATLEHLCEAKRALGDHKSTPDARKSVANRLAKQMVSLPGDAMFLRSLGPGLSEGYVAYLRRIIEVPDTEVAINVPQATEGRAYERVARLTSPYVYGLTQKLASVFSSIGLPGAYEDSRNSYIDSFAAPWCETT